MNETLRKISAKNHRVESDFHETFSKDQSKAIVLLQLEFYPSGLFTPCLRANIQIKNQPGRVAQSVRHLTRKSGVLGSIPGLATYFHFSFRFFKKGSCQLLAKVCARSTGLPLRRSKPAQEKCG